MKNYLNLILVIFCLTTLNSCDEKNEEVQSKELSNEILNRGICPDGQELVVSVSWAWDIFEKFNGLTCKDGWGFCFQAGPVWTFDCVKIKSVVAAKVAFDLQTNSGTSIGITNEENKTCTFYFHKNIMSSNVYQTKNFSTLSIGPDLYIDSAKTKKLVQGDYPIVMDGDYFKYTIDYVEM
jgi:hypothetical protein